MLEIVSLDISIKYDQFCDVADKYIEKATERYGTNCSWSAKDCTLSNARTSMKKIIFTSGESNDVNITIVAQTDKDKIIFKPFNIRGYANGFYQDDYSVNKTQEDSDCATAEFCLVSSLIESAKLSNGTIACIPEYFFDTPDQRYVFVNKGRNMSNRIKGIAFVDDNNKVYSFKNEDIQVDTDDETGYVPKYIISEWLDENLQFQQRLQQVEPNEKFKLMAQYAIYQKEHDMITASQFRDLFVQIGSFVDIDNINDERIRFVYKFIV